MTALSPSPERSRELELLRRRAYGPDADIVLDPAAQRRLRELEDLARHVGATDDDPVDARPPGADDAKVDRGRVGVSERGRQDGGRVEYPPARDRRSGWRRMPLWAMTAVVGVVVGVVVGLLWPTGSAPPPDLTLGVDASGGRRVRREPELLGSRREHRGAARVLRRHRGLDRAAHAWFEVSAALARGVVPHRYDDPTPALARQLGRQLGD